MATGAIVEVYRDFKFHHLAFGVHRFVTCIAFQSGVFTCERELRAGVREKRRILPTVL